MQASLDYEVYAVFSKESKERVSQWYSRKHDAVNKMKKDYAFRHHQSDYFVARVLFTTKELEVVHD